VAVTYNYYMIDSNTVLLLEVDGNFGIGRMEAQTAMSYNNSSLAANAGFAFGSHGDTNGTLSGTGTPGSGGVNTVGAFTVDGLGTVTGGSLDSVQDGNPISAVTISGGNYNADPSGDGRYTVSLTTSNGTILEVFYMVSPTRGFFLVNDTTLSTVQDGTADQQTSTSGLTGQYAFVMGGSELASPANFLDRVGTITTDGAGNLGWAEVANSDGSVTSPGCLAGTYGSGGSNGRFTATVSGLPADLVMYAISPNQAYLLQDDSLVQLYGGMALQTGTVNDPPGTLVKKQVGK
jgi:autotransporter family porin